MIYVDWLMNHGWKMHGKYIKSCHLFADTGEELIEFSKKIGLKKNWLQKGSLLHFDLTESKRKLAVKNGAEELTKDTFKKIYYKLKKT